MKTNQIVLFARRVTSITQYVCRHTEFAKSVQNKQAKMMQIKRQQELIDNVVRCT